MTPRPSFLTSLLLLAFAPLGFAAELNLRKDDATGTITVHRAGAAKDAAPLLTQNARADFRPYLHPIVAAYLQHTKGPAVLAGGLAGVKVPEELAIAATRLAQASGRDVGPLVAALRTAGNLKPIGLKLTPDDRRSLLADAAAQDEASRVRGRENWAEPGRQVISQARNNVSWTFNSSSVENASAPPLRIAAPKETNSSS